MAKNKSTSASPAQGGASELTKRILSAIVLAPVVLGAVYYGGLYFVALIALAGVLICWEWSGFIAEKSQWRYALVLGGLVLVLVALAHFGLLRAIGMSSPLFLGVALMSGPQGRQFWMVGGMAYAGLAVVAMIILRADPALGLTAMLFVLLSVWACDIAAYISGRAIGGPKLAPKISPGKTWAGFIGGVLASALTGFGVATAFSLAAPTTLALVALGLGAISQGGDLLESAIKRYFNRKEASNLIPGHGGVMDRLDGVIAACVAACILGGLRMGPTDIAKGLLLW